MNKYEILNDIDINKKNETASDLKKVVEMSNGVSNDFKLKNEHNIDFWKDALKMMVGNEWVKYPEMNIIKEILK